jgi:hypothetical protein
VKSDNESNLALHLDLPHQILSGWNCCHCFSCSCMSSDSLNHCH